MRVKSVSFAEIKFFCDAERRRRWSREFADYRDCETLRKVTAFVQHAQKCPWRRRIRGRGLVFRPIRVLHFNQHLESIDVSCLRSRSRPAHFDYQSCVITLDAKISHLTNL